MKKISIKKIISFILLFSIIISSLGISSITSAYKYQNNNEGVKEVIKENSKKTFSNKSTNNKEEDKIILTNEQKRILKKYEIYEKQMNTYTKDLKKVSQEVEVELFILQNTIIKKYEKILNDSFGFALLNYIKNNDIKVRGDLLIKNKTNENFNIDILNKLKNFNIKFTGYNILDSENVRHGLYNIELNNKLIGTNNSLLGEFASKSNQHKLNTINNSFPNISPNQQITFGQEDIYKFIFENDILNKIEDDYYKKLLTSIMINSKDIFKLLKEEKIFTVVKSGKNEGKNGQEHYLAFNPKFLTKFYLITEVDLLYFIKNDKISGYIGQTISNKKSKITRFNNGLFRYTFKTKKINSYEEKNGIEQPRETIFAEFNKHNILKFLYLFTNKDKFFIDKDDIYFLKNDKKFNYYIHLSDRGSLGKFEIKDSFTNLNNNISFKYINKHNILFIKNKGKNKNNSWEYKVSKQLNNTNNNLETYLIGKSKINGENNISTIKMIEQDKKGGIYNINLNSKFGIIKGDFIYKILEKNTNKDLLNDINNKYFKN